MWHFNIFRYEHREAMIRGYIDDLNPSAKYKIQNLRAYQEIRKETLCGTVSV